MASSQTLRDRVRARLRARLRAQGLPDVNSPEFAERARRECEIANRSPHAEEDVAWVDSLADDFL